MASSILNYQQSHLDLNKIESINKCQLVDLINNFTINYLDKLKSLMVKVDSRLFKLNSKIIICQSDLCILESRIKSIPDLNEITELKESKEDFNRNLNEQDTQNKKLEDNEVDQTDEQLISQPKNEPNNYPINTEVLDENPDLIKYRKMVGFGVPKDAVRLKMRTDGYDPDLLK